MDGGGVDVTGRTRVRVINLEQDEEGEREVECPLALVGPLRSGCRLTGVAQRFRNTGPLNSRGENVRWGGDLKHPQIVCLFDH